MDFLIIHWLKVEGGANFSLRMFSALNTLSFLIKSPIRKLSYTNANTLRTISGRYFATGAIDSPPEMNKYEGSSNSQDKKDGPWSGKNAWKLGALSLGASMAFAVGFGIAQWGMPICCTFILS